MSWGPPTYVDPSWEIMPVVNPEVRAGKRRRLLREAVVKDPVGVTEPKYQLKHRDEIVLPSALDRASRELLLRTQFAINQTLDSDVDEAGLPELVAEATLLRHEWEIALALRDITDLRAEHELNSAASAGPMTAAILAPHLRAVQLAEEGILSRVTALEQYAVEVHAAGSAYRDWQDALRVAGMNDRYLDLVARTAADEHAVAEISGLAEQAAAAARTFRETLPQVSQAAAALALPGPQ
jgi:hypothetical protein